MVVESANAPVVSPVRQESSALTVDALFTRGQDDAAWREKYRLGQVPGSSFYGLDQLSEYGFSVDYRQVRRPSPLARAVNAVGGKLEWVEEIADRRRGNADVILSWTESRGVPAAFRRHRPPVATGVIWLTDSDRSLPAPAARAARSALSRAEAVWALSTAQLPILRERFGVRRDRSHFLPFGIDCAFWSGQREPQPDLVVSVGNDRHRDHTTLMSATGRLRATRPSVRVELVTSHTLNHSVRPDVQHEWLPHDKLRDLYRRAAVVVVCTKYNEHVSGMTALLEAGAMGVPVVATRTPGISDYLVDGRTGILVEPGDPDGLAQAVQGLLADPDKGTEIGAAAQTYVRAHHSEQTQAGALADILRAAVGSP